MIGSKNGQAVFETTSILNETTNLVVYKIDHAVISSTRTAHVMFVEANFPSIGVKPLLGPPNSGAQSPMMGLGKSRWI
jgi:hypothetical protein